jgi:uncharacterized protein DUF664
MLTGCVASRTILDMRTLLSALTVAVAIAVPARAQGIQEGDRQRLLAHLEMTERWLVSELEGLSPEQLTFHMTPESWNIMEVVEHLAIAEPQYWQRVRESMKQPASGRKPNYAATTADDPRSRMLLEGNMDVYQWLLMISTHSQRHMLQIREIKAHASYPRGRG